MNALINMVIFSMTKAQIGITVAVAVVLAGLIVANFVVLYMLNKKRRESVEGRAQLLREHVELYRVKLTEKQEEAKASRVHLTLAGEAVGSDDLSAADQARLQGKARLLIRAKEDDDDDDNIMHYNRSFEARFIQSKDDLKEWYSDVKNTLLAYADIRSNISWKWESFRNRRRTLAKLMIRGKSLCVYMAVESLDVENVKLRLEDASGMASMKDTPILARIKSDKHLSAVINILRTILEKFGLEETDREPVDYYKAYCGTLALIKKGLIKRVVRDAATMPKPKLVTESPAEDEKESAQSNNDELSTDTAEDGTPDIKDDTPHVTEE